MQDASLLKTDNYAWELYVTYCNFLGQMRQQKHKIQSTY